MHHLHSVYNTVNDSPRSTLQLVIRCVVFLLAISFCIMMYLRKGRNAVVTLRGGGKVNPFLFALVPITIFFLMFLSTDILEINVYRHDKALLNSNSKELKILEGTVKNYYPESKEGHGEEFTVQDTLFHYSHFEEGRSGYHQTFLYGGVIRQNLYVRITYYYDGDRNAILKLETE
ncbi:hypothetical protein SAMN05216464_10993 [Mucilaginibacter pineti]|uniref:Uncharacterized protein n=1 Tax=Mucilaginibacter pineti TaxID=1391627 RepID=A0A1G7FJX9_9SPHI|nr:hypothetical protein SAMN05216464_10993 [Mucilaginibacter pineti]